MHRLVVDLIWRIMRFRMRVCRGSPKGDQGKSRAAPRRRPWRTCLRAEQLLSPPLALQVALH